MPERAGEAELTTPVAGRPVAPVGARLDGRQKVTGALRFAADISRPGMLWAKALRSPLPHARIVSIDVANAQSASGVRAVLTAEDLPDCRVGRSMRDMPVLARDKVRFVGEKIAAVAADCPEAAEKALGLITVEFEELPAVFDPLEAMQPGAPLIHDPSDVRARATAQQVVPSYRNGVSSPTWGATEEELSRALEQAEHVFEHTFRTPIQHQGYLEPHACLVEIDPSVAGGVAHIWASNKAPFLLLDYLQRGLGLSREQVEIHILPLGGDFGGKGSFMDIPLAYFLARETGRPVRMVMSYSEELMAGNPRHAAVVTVRSGFDVSGRLVARSTRAVFNSGAYAAFKPAPDATLPGIRGGGVGAYDVPVWRVEGHMVYTNTVPGGHMRAPGEAQTMHAVECHTDLCARAMGLDPLELRLRNAPTRARQTPSGAPASPPRAAETLRAAARAIDWGKTETGVGRGIALIHLGNSLGVYSARMSVARGGQIVLSTPIVENGAGMLTVFQQITAAEFGVPLEQVRIEQTMEGFQYDRGVGGSRITRLLGRIIAMLTRRLQERLAEILASELGQAASPIRIEPGGFRTPDERFHSLAEVAALMDEDVSELLRYDPVPRDSVEVYSSQATEVEVDSETGQVKVRRVVTAHETGRIVNQILHQGQIEGALIQGLGYALTEGLRLEEGRVANLNLHEYKLPCIGDIPPLSTILLEPTSELGITPIGEGTNCGISASIVNAIVDVVGQQVDIPVAPDQIRRLLLSAPDADPSAI